MRERLPIQLIRLAEECRLPLYVVGGSVRDFVAGLPEAENPDWDLSSPAPEDEILTAAEKCGFRVRAVYRHTGTVKLEDENGVGYEFTRFRSDTYVRGLHAPASIEFTQDIKTDARRRDFCANAVYYDVAKGEFADPLCGIPDIKNKILRTVAPATKVFGEDGLRLMRLARIAAQTGFSPDEECLAGAREHAALISDIVPERIYTELNLLLHSDAKQGDKTAPYRGLKILQETGVLHRILPELTLGEGMVQRADFHSYDVLEHSLRCVLYAPPEVRLAALLHDVGKPYCMLRDGNFHAHPDEGARIAAEILTRLKAPKALTEEVCVLIKQHMRDFDLKMREGKIRRELLRLYPMTERYFALKQADFSACKDDLSPAPSVVKWREILTRMQKEGVPFTLSGLAVNGRELQMEGVPPQETGRVLKELLLYCAMDGTRNKKEHLLSHLKKTLRF